MVEGIRDSITGPSTMVCRRSSERSRPAPNEVSMTRALESVLLVLPSAGSFVRNAAYHPSAPEATGRRGTSSPYPENPVTLPSAA